MRASEDRGESRRLNLLRVEQAVLVALLLLCGTLFVIATQYGIRIWHDVSFLLFFGGILAEVIRRSRHLASQRGDKR